MKKIAGIALLLLTILVGTAFGAGMAPEVVLDPFDTTQTNRVVKFVVDAAGDQSWARIPLLPFDPTDHASVKVSFDVYRVRAATDWMAEWFNWSWGNDGLLPFYGGQYQPDLTSAAITYPFVGAGYTTGTTPTVFDQYVNVTLIWDIVNGYISSSYAGGQVDINQPLTSQGTLWRDFMFSLDHLSGVSEGDTVYLDNFLIEGSDIYNSFGFDNFALGGLAGQNGWIAGNDVGAVPEPGSLLLLCSGVLGLAFWRRRAK